MRFAILDLMHCDEENFHARQKTIIKVIHEYFTLLCYFRPRHFLFMTYYRYSQEGTKDTTKPENCVISNIRFRGGSNMRDY